MEGQLVVAKPQPAVISYVGKRSAGHAGVDSAFPAPACHAGKLVDELEDLLFFQPVIDGRSNSYITLLGDQPHFDFLAQPFKPKQIEFDLDSHWFSSITAVSEGEPLTCSLANVPFQTLSNCLHVWHGSEVSYHATKPMPLNQQKTCFLC